MATDSLHLVVSAPVARRGLIINHISCLSLQPQPCARAQALAAACGV